MKCKEVFVMVQITVDVLKQVAGKGSTVRVVSLPSRYSWFCTGYGVDLGFKMFF